MVNVYDNSYFERVAGLEGLDLRDHYKKTGSFKHVTPAVVVKWRKMRGMRAVLEKHYSRTIDDISNEEIAQYVVKNWFENLKDKPAKKTSTSHYKEEDIDKRLAAYLQHFEAKTANDISSLRQLCLLEEGIEQLEKVESTLLSDLRAKKPVSETFINSIVNARVRYLNEYRQLQVMLGIDRVSRDKAEGETGGEEYMRGLMHSAKELLDSKSVKIFCSNCKNESVVLQMGFILCHFSGWEFTMKCPRCTAKINLNG